MALNALLTSSNTLIAGRYAVDTSQVLPEGGGGVAAYIARDRMAADARRIALAVSRTASPRLKHLKLLDEPVDNLMVPLGHGLAPLHGKQGEGYFVVCTHPPGPPVSLGLNSWPEKVLVDLVLRPAATVLDILQSHKLTHRAIRPNNVFQASPGQSVTLGAAWAAPPAMHQSAAFETPYNAMCHPATRGDGLISDDVYALGVLLLTLSGGKVPMAGMDDATIIRWKLDLGSFAALTRDFTLSGFLADLLRGMLAEDPDHRPLPSALMERARSRQITSRPGRRSQSPLMLNEVPVFDARALAWGLLNDERKAIQFLRNGLITQWLRRGLGDAALATKIEDLIRSRMAETRATAWSDALLVMHTISALSPRMPLCWRGVALWPDALASMLAEGIESRTEMATGAEELLVADIFGVWGALEAPSGRPPLPDMLPHRQLLHQAGPNGLLRLFYVLNPVLPCRLPAMAAMWVATIPDLMRFVESAAESAGNSLIDPHMAAFIAARADRKIEMQVNSLTAIKDVDSFRRAELGLLRDMQARYQPSPMPALGKWVAAQLRPNIDRWRSKHRRTALHAQLDVLATKGSVARLLELTEDPDGQALDQANSVRANDELVRIDTELAAIDDGDRLRYTYAEGSGHAIAGGIGLSAFILTAMSVLFR